MQLTRESIYKLYGVLEDLNSKSGSVRFHYKCVKNMKKLLPEVEFIRTQAKPSQRFQDFESKRLDIINTNSLKDKSGNVKWEIEGTLPKFKSRNEVEMQLKALLDEYSEELKEADKKNAQMEQFMKESVDVDLLTFQVEELPEGSSGAAINALIDLIEEK